MRVTSCLAALCFAVIALIPSQGFSTCSFESYHLCNRQRDFEAVQQFVNSKRTVLLVPKEQFLKFSGDVRTEMYYRTESQDGKELRGHGRYALRGKDSFDMVLNWQVDYKCGRSWAQAKLQHDNAAGVTPGDCARDRGGLFGSGFCDDSCVKRAFIGYRVLECDDYYFDVEVGRRPLNTIFDSYIQFKNRFDGIRFKYDYTLRKGSNFYIHGGPFVVDERVDYYAVVVEAAVLNLMDWKTDVKYSYIDWTLSGKNVCGTKDPRGSQFRNSQFTLDYNLMQYPILDKKTQLYGAWLINTAAKPRELTRFKKENIGWYAGIIVGDVKKKGDWAVDISYEYCEAQAVPDTDVSGIDRGNVLGDTFYANGRGKANYKGWEFQYLYAITKKLQVNAIYAFSKPVDVGIGGRHNYSKFEVDIIHAF